MADTALSSVQEAPERETDRAADPIGDSQYAAAALEAHKREGLELAVRARWIAMAVISIFLVAVNPAWDVLYYHAILLILCLNGWLIQRFGQVGRSRAELMLIFLDLLVMTVGIVAPHPFSPEDLPVAMQYRFDNFLYFFVILAGGTLAFSWRTVIAIGVWTSAMWAAALGLAWWYATPYPELTEATQAAFGPGTELPAAMDPNNFAFPLRIQEIFVFLLVAVTLGVSSRRFSRLLMDNAGLERERANLSRYFSPNVVDQLSQNDDPLKQVRSQDVGVLFIDIVGFTRMSAGQDPHQVIELLRDFHGRMEREVFRYRGTLDKYLGDGLMATFGTPMAGPHDATDTLACARAMQDSLSKWNRDRRRRGEPEICAGIGIHFGETVLGDIGANRLEYAVIGTAVNVAARLEEMTRSLQAQIVMSGELRGQVMAENAALDLLDGFSCHEAQDIRGLDQTMQVWSLPANPG
ncbi:adenylate/guanylate cyclase domain-containing protein [Phaeobacter sp. QD34_3]|uniref:adenylate/guanylate cyclase domain-containing protein n=1 Tax=unclassified Phaeobacter TaxID=2621772 RepID=UPI00237F85FB|nr:MULTISPECIES: adenylate/guanylate cyclase domain-containing protein [unclassified Phaeobacter]MDE4132297.1 adenylate/guanylate cyclase domain-containing protein [Phaeobacter sp. QD34_3]MDE4135935.1 adenylate/guanylate cyclase domain-containing protein [Phaeobacter sp. QD34_24]